MIERFLVALLVIIMATWAAGAFVASHIISRARRDELERLVDQSVDEALKQFEKEKRTS